MTKYEGWEKMVKKGISDGDLMHGLNQDLVHLEREKVIGFLF